MADKFPTIFIPEQNDFIYCLTVPGIELDTATDIEVFASLEPARTSKLGYTYSGNQIKIPFRNLKQGEYNLWVTFISAGQRVSYNYKAAFKIVAWNNRFVNWEEYKQGSELAVDAGVCLLTTFEEGDWATMWNTIEQLESLKENCKAAAQEAHEAAEYAKQEGERAKDVSRQIKIDADEAVSAAKGAAKEAHEQVERLKEESNDATKRANDAAGNADGKAKLAEQKAKDAEDAAKEAEKQAKEAIQAAKEAGDAKSKIETDYASVKAGLQAAYAQTSSALEADYEQKINALNAEYSETERALSADYAQKKAQLDADYLSAKQSLDSRMSAIETQYSTDKAGWQNQVDNFLAECQRIFDSKEATRDAAVDAKIEEIEAAAGQSAVYDLTRDFGKYVQRPDVTLEVVQTGKRFTKDGEMVADANWNIGRIGSVERGLLYELFMGGSDKMVLCTALFVSHTVEKRGTQDVDIYTPVFSALGTDLPVSNYAVLWAGENYSDLLVSYRADVAGANVMRVAEWGLFKSIATQYANLKAQVNLKSFADGYYAGMRVGTADNLTPRGEASEEMFRERIAGGTNEIEDGAASIRSIKGKTLKVVQLINDAEYSSNVVSGITATKNADNSVTFNGTVTTGYNYSFSEFKHVIAGHKYLQGFAASNFECNGNVNFYVYDVDNRSLVNVIYINSKLSAIFTANNTCTIRIYINTGAIGRTMNGTITPQLFDLTAMFGAGNEPTSVQAFAEAMGYNSIDEMPYVPYTEGKLIPSKVEGVKTTGRNFFKDALEIGSISTENGQNASGSTQMRTVDYTEVIGGATIAAYCDNGNAGISIRYYDAQKNYIGFESIKYFVYHPTWVIPINCKYIRFGLNSAYGTTDKKDILLCYGNIADSFEPYEVHERKWGETLKKYFPDGLKSAGDVYDEITPTKAIKRIGVVDLGTLNWAYKTPSTGLPFFFTQIFSMPERNGKLTCSAYQTDESTSSVWSNVDKRINSKCPYAANEVNVVDSAYTDAAALKAALQGVMLYYELKPPEEYTYDELNLTERVFAGGMESAIVPEGDESAPLVADIVYPIDAYNTIKANKAKIEDLQQKPAISLTADEVTKLRALISTATQSEGGEL